MSYRSVSNRWGSCLLLTGLFALACPLASNAAPVATNVLIIYADDLGYGDVQCYNPERGKIATPHLDRLASQGMRFTDAHSSSAVCSPSRYTLLTGRYHWRSRLQKGIVGLWGKPLIAADRLTVAGLAKQRGYRTACIGKWHLGWDWPIPEEQGGKFRRRPDKQAEATEEMQALWRQVFSQSIGGGPLACGFDQYFGTDVPNWPPYCFIENNQTIGIPTAYLPPPLLAKNQASIQGPALKDWKLEPILPTLGERAAEFFQDQASDPQPFLLYLPLTSPHTPLAVNGAWQGKSDLNLYADFVMETDAVVGRVLDALDDNDLAKDTLVIFTSDNGCAPYIGVDDLESQGHYPSGPLRGYKSDAWEGGHRVPFVARWPGTIEPGSVCDQLIHQADVMATLAELFDVSLPADAAEDSYSLRPLFHGGQKPIRTEAVSCSAQGLPSIRDGSWKLILGPGSGGWSKGTSEQPVQLYDLSVDLAESNNLAAEYPERVADMQAQMKRCIANGRSTQGSSQTNDVDVVQYPR